MNKTAYLLIRPLPHYRRGSFEAGLRALGFQIGGVPRGTISPADVLVMWNRYGPDHRLAEHFSKCGGTVIVAENGLLGRDRPDGHWYSLALDYPAAMGGALPLRIEGWNRTDIIGAKLGELRQGGDEVMVLEQRGIGPPDWASPPKWAEKMAARLALDTNRLIRIRAHPGENKSTPIEDDLRNVWCVVTWASSAAIRAMVAGVPVFYALPTWIAKAGGRQLWGRMDLENPLRDPYARRMAIERVGRSTWHTMEIETGEPFARLLERSRFTRSKGTTAAS